MKISFIFAVKLNRLRPGDGGSIGLCIKSNGVSFLYGVASAVHSTNCRLRPTSVPPYNGDHMMHEVGRFWMMKPDADLLRLLPASDLDNTEQQTEVVKR